MDNFTAADGSIVTDGDKLTLTLAKGSEATADYSTREVKGKVRAYEHVDRVLDEEGYAVDKVVTIVWEISTGDPSHPAVGFRPENVLSAKK
jgi:hypothetical protein